MTATGGTRDGRAAGEAYDRSAGEYDDLLRHNAEGAARLVAGLEALILAVLERPETRLGDLPLLRPDEQRELIAAAAGAVAGPARLPVHRRFQEQAARTPDAAPGPACATAPQAAD